MYNTGTNVIQFRVKICEIINRGRVALDISAASSLTWSERVRCRVRVINRAWPKLAWYIFPTVSVQSVRAA